MITAPTGRRVHGSPEFLCLVAGILRHEGRRMSDGGTHAAVASSVHLNFADLEADAEIEQPTATVA